MRILGLLKQDPSEEDQLPEPEVFERMGVFMEEVIKAGVLVSTDGLQPTRKGKRVKLDGGKLQVIDGPFTEAKEVVASYAIFEVSSMEEAVEWTTKFLKVLGSGECELRPIFAAEDFPQEVMSPEAQEKEAAWRAEMERQNK